MVIFKQKKYTQWDETDRLKQMKDSDILAEKKKKGTGLDTLGTAAMGAGSGAVLGGIIGAGKGLATKGSRLSSAAKGLKSGGKLGALAGGIALGTAAAIKNSKKQRETNFYNDRLRYAQNQAYRRERADWKNNMTNREGYTY